MQFGIRVFIFFVVLLAVPLASFWYVFKPRNAEIAQAKQEISVKEERLNRLQAVAMKISDMREAIVQGQRDIEAIEQQLPSEKGVHLILEQITELAGRNGLTVKSVKSEKPVPAATYKEQPMRMEINGVFDGFYQFLLELENLPRITRVHNMKLERASTATPSKKDSNEYPEGWMFADLQLSIYFQPEDKRLAGN